MIYFRKAQVLVRRISNQPDYLIGRKPTGLELRQNLMQSLRVDGIPLPCSSRWTPYTAPSITTSSTAGRPDSNAFSISVPISPGSSIRRP